MKKQTKIILLILVIILNIILAYLPHLSNPYPLLGDEYDHISLAKFILEENKLPLENPYYFIKTPHFNLESGFHIFLAVMFKIIPGDPIIYYKYFIILFMVINSLLLFYLMNLWFKNYLSALLAVFFFGMIRTTGDFLAHAYFIPLTLGITLLLTSLIFFYKWEKTNKRKYIIYLIIASIFNLFTYPPSLLFFLGSISLYVIFQDNNLYKNFNLGKKQFYKYSLTFLTIFTLISLLILYKLNLLSQIIFDLTWTNIQTQISPIFFFGVIPTFLAIVGLIYITHTKKYPLLWYMVILSIIEIYLFSVFEFTILIPFRRVFMFYLISLSMLAGLGCAALPLYLKKYFNLKYAKEISIAIIVILLITTLIITLNNPLPKKPVNFLDNEKYQAILFLKENYIDQKMFVISDITTSRTIYASTTHKIMKTISNLGHHDIEYDKFMPFNCVSLIEFNKFIKEYDTSMKGILLTNEEILNCNTLKEVYSKQGWNIYELTNN